MSNAMWAAVLGSRIETQRLDIVANNLANADTPGFKADASVFQSHLDYISKRDYDLSRRSLKNINRYMNSATDPNPGPIMSTGRSGDMAIEGSGYFVVQSQRGEAYTRAGNFRLDVDGNLVTASGDPVLGDGGPITLPVGAEFEVRPDGTIVVGAEEIDRVRVEDVQDPRQLRKMGSSLFFRSATAAVNTEPEFQVVDKALEGSNVNVMREMAVMVTAGRQYEAFQAAIRTISQVNSRAGETLAKA
ncbi:MAG: flagellar basal-body rod protein FlgF [Deltaproteobacteria bacterium]|nr:flagellar basal-body rod protein FlgF [Deltaproteobacteria bacterium]